MNIMKVKPKAGLLVRDPETKLHIPKEGMVVPKNCYWMRRVLCGDVEEVEEVGEKKAEPVKKKKEKNKLDKRES